jgi:hypothetical protein
MMSSNAGELQMRIHDDGTVALLVDMFIGDYDELQTTTLLRVCADNYGIRRRIPTAATGKWKRVYP